MASARLLAENTELKVFITAGESACQECGEELGRGAWILLAGERGAPCLSCADLDHLVFLPSGDPALTRRARKNATLSAVVLQWSRARKRYERQGILVEETAMASAEAQCLADEDARARRRSREDARRATLDRDYVERFTQRVRELFPRCPDHRDRTIAEHACLKYSGRVGRSAAAKAFDEEAVRLAVVAHIRHVETPYDELLAKGWDRRDARLMVADQVRAVLDAWQGS